MFSNSFSPRSIYILFLLLDLCLTVDLEKDLYLIILVSLSLVWKNNPKNKKNYFYAADNFFASLSQALRESVLFHTV